VVVGGERDRARPDAPILVTGMPRSGTTWIARVLASAPGTALAGREPMNPRRRQYALGGTLESWARLEAPTRRQAFDLRLAYRGINPWVFSRYGRRQWAAPWPGTRIIVKDPFAALSLPAVTATTGARALVTYRHPGAMLVSYRRVGWRPDLAEIRPHVRRPDLLAAAGRGLAEGPDGAGGADVRAMAAFWAALYDQILADLDRVPGALLISHEDLAGGGEDALRTLYAALDLGWSEAAGRPFATPATPLTEGPAERGSTAGTALHNFDRAPAQVAAAWTAALTPDELSEINALTADVQQELAGRRLRLS
jgi:Sulfotransferase family